MACTPIRDEQGNLVAIARTRGSRRRCSVVSCKGPGAFLCDGPGCDVPLCGHHRTRLADGRDLCGRCYRLHAQANGLLLP